VFPEVHASSEIWHIWKKFSWKKEVLVSGGKESWRGDSSYLGKNTKADSLFWRVLRRKRLGEVARGNTKKRKRPKKGESPMNAGKKKGPRKRVFNRTGGTPSFEDRGCDGLPIMHQQQHYTGVDERKG